MDKYNKKELERLMDRVMDDATLESPSKDFTKNLMSKIEAQSGHEAVQYRPILSKKVLVGIVGLFVAAFIIGLANGADSGSGWFQTVHIGPYFDKLWGWMEFFTSSKATMYAVLLFGFLFFVQVPWLKRYIERHGMLES